MMPLSTMRRFDTWVGWPAAVLLGLVPHRRRTLPVAPRQIVIVKLSGLGSLLTCAGVFRALRSSQPQARLVVVSLEGTAAAARLIPEVDEVLAISVAGVGRMLRDGWRVLRELRRRRVEVMADIECFSKLSTVFCALAGARYRMGFRLPARWRRRLIDGGCTFREDIHFCACVARLLQPLGVDYGRLPAAILRPSPAAEEAATALLAEAPGARADTDWMVVNPHASELCVQRRWPVERFAQVVSALLQQHPALRIAIPGTAGERARAEALRASLPAEQRERVRVLAGRTDLGTLAAILRRSRLVLTGDTGVMHLSAAVGAPTVALFGPESPVRYGPVGGLHAGRTGPVDRVLTGDVPCGPCLSYMNHKRAPCQVEPAACMLAISADDVQRACADVLKGAG
ncbi:MAG: glycosyltransferase family 9 protein [Kiritimatiellia bacterium]